MEIYYSERQIIEVFSQKKPIQNKFLLNKHNQTINNS